ncbi:MAG: SRPBCC family protein [Rubrobacter sp.]
MKIHNEFTVGASIDQAWNTMLDLEKIAPCLPGADIQDEADGEYAGTMKIKVGPITASYKGTVRFEEADEANHRAVLQATGRDVRGQGTASATIVSTLREEGGSTKVSVETDLKLTGRAAQFGSGLAQDVATRMLDQFAACLEQEISGAGAAEAAAQPASGNGPRAATLDGPPSAAGAGATVQGAIVTGSSPSGAAAGAPTTGIQQPTTQDTPRRAPAREPEAFDLGDTTQGAIFKRLTPVLAGAGVLVILTWLFRRKW